MSKNAKNLKTVSIIIIAIGIIDLISIIMSVFLPEGVLNSLKVASTMGSDNNQAVSAVLGFLVFTEIIAFLATMIIGLKGIIIANGGKRSILAYVLAFLTLILAIFGIISTFTQIASGKIGFIESQVIVTIVSAILTIYYIYVMKKTLDERVR